MGTGTSKKPRKKLRPPLSAPPQFSIDISPGFFPGSRNWDPAETLSAQFPLGHVPTETLKREFRRMERIRDRQEAFFPGIKADHNFDRSRSGRAATPNQVKGAVKKYIEWLKIELSLRRGKRPSSRAAAGEPVSSASTNVNTSEALKAGGTSTSVGAAERLPRTPKRRVSDASADFDKTVGKWMHEAHSRLERQGLKASRGRKTPNLPPAQYEKIVQQTDRAERDGKPRFPLKDVLSQKVWKDIADHNTKAGSAEKKFSLWGDIAYRRQFKRAVHYRFNRAELHYRKYFVPKQL